MNKNIEIVKSKDLFEKFYRGTATFLVKFLVKTPITGNMITVFRGFLFIPFCLLLALYSFIGIPAWIAYIIAVIGIQIWDVLDCVDGTLARAKNQAGTLGEWFEMLIDRPIGGLAGFFGICLVLGLYYETGIVFLWVLLAMIILGQLLKMNFIFINTIMNIPEDEDRKWRIESREFKKSFLGEILYFFNYREFGVFAICALLYLPLSYLGLNTIILFILFYALFNNLVWMGIAFIQYKNLRKKW